MADGFIREERAFGYVQLEWTLQSQSVIDNTSTISYKLFVQRNTGEFSDSTAKAYSITINGTTVASGSISLHGYGTKTVKTGTTTIKHNANGSKTFALSFSQAIGLSYGTISGSGTGTLTTINRLSTISVSQTDKTLGVAQTMTVKKVDSSLIHTITYKYGTMVEIICSYSSETSLSFTIPIYFAQENTTGLDIAGYFEIKTYQPDKQLVGTSTLNVTYKIPNSLAPTCEFTWAEVTTNHLEKYGVLLKGQSHIGVMLNASGKQNAEIASYNMLANGTLYKTNYVEDVGVLKSAPTVTLTGSVIDKRGLSGTAEPVTIDVYDYNQPIIEKLTVSRCNADRTPNDGGAYCLVTFSASISSINDQNTATYKLKYKKTSESESEYTTLKFASLDGVYLVTNHQYSFLADDGSSYDVQLVIADDLVEETRATTLSTAYTILHFGAKGNGIGIGKLDEEADPFEVGNNPGLADFGFAARFNEDVCGTVAGLGRLPPIPLNSNFNDYITIGCGGVYSDGVANTISNIPVTKAGRFEVISSNGKGLKGTGIAYLRQRYSPYSLNFPVYERDITRDSTGTLTFGDWKATSLSNKAQTVLWSDGTGLVMGEDETIELAESVSAQANGVVLVFRCTVTGQAMSFFVPKALVGVSQIYFLTNTSFSYIGAKNLKITDTTIEGSSNNESSGTSPFKFNNSYWALSRVIGV